MILKRVVDLVGSLIGLIVLSPLFLLIALLIKFDSEGPVFFKQERIGKNGEPFILYKFRTMVKNAESKGSGVFTEEKDPRITRIGSILRKTSLDELPQLINVLKGEMSLVGPRPPVPYHPYEYKDYPDKYKVRFNLKPGITGLAQVNGRNNLSWEERFEYDLEYVRKQNLFIDIKIMVKTFFKIANQTGLYGERDK